MSLLQVAVDLVIFEEMVQVEFNAAFKGNFAERFQK